MSVIKKLIPDDEDVSREYVKGIIITRCCTDLNRNRLEPLIAKSMKAIAGLQIRPDTIVLRGAVSANSHHRRVGDISHEMGVNIRFGQGYWQSRVGDQQAPECKKNRNFRTDESEKRRATWRTKSAA